MRVKSGKRILNVKGPQYTKIRTKSGKRVGARHIGGWIERKKKPQAFRTPTMETLIRKGIRLVKAFKKTKKKKTRRSPKRVKDTLERVPISELLPKRPLLGRDRYNLVEIELSQDGEEYLRQLKRIDPITYRLFVGQLGFGLRGIHRNVRYVGRRLIGLPPFFEHGMVPKDTGRLRRDLYRSLSEDYSVIPNPVTLDHRNLELRIGFYSDLPYVGYLSKVGIRIKHFGWKRSWRTRVPLYDPGAKREFMKIIPRNLRRVAMGNFYSMCRRVAPIVGLSANDVKNMFKVKHIRGRLRTL